MVPGLDLTPDVLTLEEEAAILACVDESPWRADLRRRVQHYGYRYDYRARMVHSDMHLGPMPEWVQEVASFVGSYIPGFMPDQVIINEYCPGQGIGAHIDCVPCFGPVVASLSLGCGVPIVFKRGAQVVSRWVPGRSLLSMSGAARWSWTHEIQARPVDPETGPRGRRVSLTFRTVDL